MFEKDLNISLLLDIYGDLLTKKQKDALDYYYNEDMSLSEISEHINITRQGVRDSIKKAEIVLVSFEEKLGLTKKIAKIQKLAEEIETNVNSILDKNLEKSFSAEIETNANNILVNLKKINDI